MDWLLNAAAASSENNSTKKLDSMVMTEIPFIRKAYVENEVWDSGEPMFMHHVPMMIMSHMRLQNPENIYSAKDIMLYLAGDQPLNINVYEAMLIHGLVSAYNRVSPEDYVENVCVALCDDVYRNVYHAIHKNYPGTAQAGDLRYQMLHKLNEKDIDKKDILRLCLSRSGIAGMYRQGGLHVGIVVANHLLWKHGDASSGVAQYIMLTAGAEVNYSIGKLIADDGTLINDDAFWNNFAELVVTSFSVH